MEKPELFTIESLSESMENDFLRKSLNVISFAGGNGIWKVKISGTFWQFKKSIEEYSKTRVYMYLQDVQLLSNASATVLVSLL